MAQTLAQFQTEFNDIKKDVPVVAHQAQVLENTSSGASGYKERMKETGKGLSARILELRRAGTRGDGIEAFTADREVAAIVREMQQLRDSMRQNFTQQNTLLTNTIKPLVARLTTLDASLTTEIAARNKNVSSKALGLNRSVKDMEPLLAQVKLYAKEANFSYLAKFKKSVDVSAAVYSGEIEDSLEAGQGLTVMANEAQTALEGQLGERKLKLNLKQAQADLRTMIAQNHLAQAAVRDGQAQALQTAKQAVAQLALKQTRLIAPYQQAWSDQNLLTQLKTLPAGPKTLKGLADFKAVKQDVDAVAKATKLLKIKAT